MGGSMNWMKSFMGYKKLEKQATNVDEKLGGGNGKRWKLWRSPSGDLSTWKKGFKARRHRAEAASEGADSPTRNEAFSSAYLSVVRAPPRSFRAVREDWAATRVQTAFRGFLFTMIEKLLTSGSDSRKIDTKAPSYNWTDNQTLILMQVLKEFRSKFGFNKLYDWAVINKAFLKKIGVDFTKHGKTVAHNKVEHMKKLWRSWSDLRFKVTGAGWDRNTGMVMLLDECWDSFKKSDNNKFLHFRIKGVDLELCELWDEVFGTTMATRKNVMAPCLLKKPGFENDKEPVIDLDEDRVDPLFNTQETKLDLLLDRELLEDDDAQRELFSRVWLNTPFEECMDSVYDSLTTPLGVDSPSATGSGPSRVLSKPKVRKTLDGLTFQELIKKKHKSVATSFNEHMKLVSHTGKKMFALMERECDSTVHGVAPKQFEFSDCYSVIYKMVKEKIFKDQSKLWCFSITKFENQDARNQFMQIDRDDTKLSWLKFEYDNHYKLYDLTDRNE